MACVQAIFPLEDERKMCEGASDKLESADRLGLNGTLFLAGLGNACFHLSRWCAPAHQLCPLGVILGVWTGLWLVGTIVHLALMMVGKESARLTMFLVFGSPITLPVSAVWSLAAFIKASYKPAGLSAEELRARPRIRHERQWARTAHLRLPNKPAKLVLDPAGTETAEAIISEAV